VLVLAEANVRLVGSAPASSATASATTPAMATTTAAPTKTGFRNDTRSWFPGHRSLLMHGHHVVGGSSKLSCMVAWAWTAAFATASLGSTMDSR
jgi:hypothetical protein